MHYYTRHIGDYARETGHLTAEEHGAMTLLMDRYLLKEAPIPADQAARIAKVDQAVVDRLLEEFFVRDGDVWRHVGADEKIARYKANAEINRANGAKGGRPRGKKAESKPGKTHPVPDPAPESGGEQKPAENPEQNPNQQPLTINQEESPPTPQTGEAAAPRRRRRARVPGSENYSPSFLRFWDEYPAGKRSRKDDAHEVWKRDKLAEFEEIIIEDVKRRKAEHWGWIKNGGEFIPGAQVYLNQHRWNDDIETPPAGWQSGRAPGKRAANEQANDEAAERWIRQNGGGTRALE